MGHWKGAVSDKESTPGAGRGGFSFERDLDKKIVVRKNHAEYDKGAVHDDLMVIYWEGSPCAIYFDSEGHTIRYNLTFPARDSVVFESDGTQAGPKYRLSYWVEKSALKGKFEVGAPDYKTYMNWDSVRK